MKENDLRIMKRTRTTRDHETLQRWLAAEGRADELAAEEALAQVLRSVRREAPSRGFAERTMIAAGLASRPSGLLRLRHVTSNFRGVRSGAKGSWSRWASAAGVGFLGLGLLLMIGVGATLFLQRIGWIGPFDALNTLTPADPFEALIATMNAFWQWIASGVVFWQRAAGVGETIRGLIDAPDVAFSLVALLLLAVSSFKALQVVLVNDVLLGKSALVTDRSRMYVDSL